MSGAVEVFTLDVDAVAPNEWGALAALLDAKERARAERFRFDEDRRAFVGAHALLRAMLSRCAPVPPAAWRFSASEFGKPFLLDPPRDLRFSLSHTRGMAAIAIVDGVEIGVDVERADRPYDMRLAERCFAPDEFEMLRLAEEAARGALFFSLWTLKEAVIKATGRGLSCPLDSFSVSLSPPRVATREADAPQCWSLAHWRSGAVHVGAAAKSESVSFRFVEITPKMLLCGARY